MTKLFFIASLLFLISCQDNNSVCPTEASSLDKAQNAQAPSTKENCTPTDGSTTPGPTNPTTDPTAPVEIGDVPQEALLFEAKSTFTNFEREDEEKVHKAIEIIKKVVASSEFRNKVINFKYNGKKTFVDNGGFTNEQIYKKLLDGKEDLKPELDHEMDLDLELYYSSRSTVGYTYPDVLKIWMNTKFFSYYTPAEVAGNIFHEWIHKLGFDHASSYSVSRDSSVPYAIGYLMEDLGKKYE